MVWCTNQAAAAGQCGDSRTYHEGSTQGILVSAVLGCGHGSVGLGPSYGHLN